MKEFKEPVGILGYGVEGQSTLRYLQKNHVKSIVVFDQKKPAVQLDNVQYIYGPHYLEHLSLVKTLFRSPGIRSDLTSLTKFTESGGDLTSQTELFFNLVSQKRIIGVTGTLGKGTCCTMIKHVLEASKKPVILLGNIGTPLLDGLSEITEDTWILIELSSFQLSTLKKSPKYAIILKTTSEHMDWHLSQQEYWEHKSHLVRQQKQEDVLIYYNDAKGSCWISQQSPAKKVSVGKKADIRLEKDTVTCNNVSFSLHDFKVKGLFNLENLGATLALGQKLNLNPTTVIQALKGFSGLEHRLEYVTTKNGVQFYNDSYATRPDATIGAIQSFDNQSIGLILGGSEKHADFTDLVSTLLNTPHLVAIALIGVTAQRLYTLLTQEGKKSNFVIHHCDSLENAGDTLLSQLKKGVILLSPACASFGLFANYKERGFAFKHWVNQLNKD